MLSTWLGDKDRSAENVCAPVIAWISSAKSVAQITWCLDVFMTVVQQGSIRPAEQNRNSQFLCSDLLAINMIYLDGDD